MIVRGLERERRDRVGARDPAVRVLGHAPPATGLWRIVSASVRSGQGLDPGPAVVDAASSSSRSPSLWITKSARASRSSREAWRAMRARASASREAPLLDQAGDGDLGVGVDHDQRRPGRRGPTRPAAARRGSPRGRCPTASSSRRAISAPTAGCTMAFRSARAVVVAEHDVGHGLAVEGAVGGDDARARSARPWPRRPAVPGCLQLADDGVGVDDDRASLGQRRRHASTCPIRSLR